MNNSSLTFLNYWQCQNDMMVANIMVHDIKSKWAWWQLRSSSWALVNRCMIESMIHVVFSFLKCILRFSILFFYYPRYAKMCMNYVILNCGRYFSWENISCSCDENIVGMFNYTKHTYTHANEELRYWDSTKGFNTDHKFKTFTDVHYII